MTACGDNIAANLKKGSHPQQVHGESAADSESSHALRALTQYRRYCNATEEFAETVYFDK